MKARSDSSAHPSTHSLFARVATREMCRERAPEIARLAGRSAAEVRLEDYFQARREITGETDPDRQDAILDASSSGSPVTQTATPCWQ